MRAALVTIIVSMSVNISADESVVVSETKFRSSVDRCFGSRIAMDGPIAVMGADPDDSSGSAFVIVTALDFCLFWLAEELRDQDEREDS